MDTILKYRYCFIAGACAAGGSFFGKLPDFLVRQMQQPKTQEIRLEHSWASSFHESYMGYALLNLLPIGLMILCNISNWRYYLHALQHTKQTLVATVLTAASNYILSFILGCTIYRESVNIFSVLGIISLLIGVWFLCDEATDGNRKSTKFGRTKHFKVN